MNQEGRKEEATFTAEQDAKILDMKSRQAPWNEIVQAIGRPDMNKGDLQTRVKQLHPEKGNSSGGEAGKANQGATKVDGEEAKKNENKGQESKNQGSKLHETSTAIAVREYRDHGVLSSVFNLIDVRELSKGDHPRFLALTRLHWTRSFCLG